MSFLTVLLIEFLFKFSIVLPGNPSDNIPGKTIPGTLHPYSEILCGHHQSTKPSFKDTIFPCLFPPPPTQDFFCQYVLRTENLLWSFKVKLILLYILQKSSSLFIYHSVSRKARLSSGLAIERLADLLKFCRINLPLKAENILIKN